MMRDPDSNAIVNKNSEIIRAAKLKKQKLREEQQRIKSLENDVADIKDMLKQLLERAGS